MAFAAKIIAAIWQKPNQPQTTLKGSFCKAKAMVVFMNYNTKEVDPNMIVETTLKESDLKFYSVRNDPFDVYGLYDYRNGDQFVRMPLEVSKTVSSSVDFLCRQTAGGRVRFCTDSTYVAFKVVMPQIRYMSHMPLSGSGGFDLFIDSESGYENCFGGSIRPDFNARGGYEGIIRFAKREKRYITVNFPSYDSVSALYIGLQNDAMLDHGLKYRNEKPVVFYGSSITQGACASRPGNNYINILSRRLNMDFVNLGFSGSAKAEPEMLDYLASLDMSVFVSDYDHNAPNVAHLEATHFKLYEKIREKHPDIPYIMASRPDFGIENKAKDSIERLNVVYNSFRRAKEAGDKNVYFLSGESMFIGRDRELCTIEGTHPTDIGFLKMANAFEDVFVRVISETKVF